MFSLVAYIACVFAEVGFTSRLELREALVNYILVTRDIVFAPAVVLFNFFIGNPVKDKPLLSSQVAQVVANVRLDR